MELSKRLQAIADLVSVGRRVADIGCDHGYVSIYLTSTDKCPKVIAMDVKEGPLIHAKANVKKYGMQERIEIRLSDGTQALAGGEVDTLLISGMGGRLINRILKDGFERLGYFEELILQPQSEIETVRQFLREQQYIIVDEDFVAEDGKYYPMIKALYRNNDTKHTENSEQSDFSLVMEDTFGPILLKKKPKDFMDYLIYKRDKSEELVKVITQADKKAEMQQYLDMLCEVLD